MPENKQLQNPPQTQEPENSLDNEDRVLVEIDGELVWLQGEAIDRYDKGELNLNEDFKTTEQKQRWEKMQQEIIQMVNELYFQKDSEGDQ